MKGVGLMACEKWGCCHERGMANQERGVAVGRADGMRKVGQVT